MPDAAFVTMKGRAGVAPGEWSPGTAMTLEIARAAAAGQDLRDEATLDDIVEAWAEASGAAPEPELPAPRRASGRRTDRGVLEGAGEPPP